MTLNASVKPQYAALHLGLASPCVGATTPRDSPAIERHSGETFSGTMRTTHRIILRFPGVPDGRAFGDGALFRELNFLFPLGWPDADLLSNAQLAGTVRRDSGDDFFFRATIPKPKVS